MSNELFAAALGVASPWYVRNVEFDAGKRLLTISIDFAKGSRFPYEAAEGLHPVHDTQTKRYRHLNFFQHGVIAWAQTRQTNGFLEAINSLFQAAKRKARGYGRLQTMRVVIFLVAGNLNFSSINPHAV